MCDLGSVRAGRMCEDVSERSNSLLSDGRVTGELRLKVVSNLLQNIDRCSASVGNTSLIVDQHYAALRKTLVLALLLHILQTLYINT